MKLANLTLKMIATTLLVTSCYAANNTISEESLGLRNTDLYSEKDTIADKTEYKKTAAGTSEKIKRAFENAPPMIPHDVEGLLPITIDNNACMGCHEPAVAPSMNATPIPKSHFTNLRPDTVLNKEGKIVKSGKVVENTSDIKTVEVKSLATLSGSRFNCSQCHAPQSENKDVPQNEFKADFRQKDLNSKSNLLDNLNEGVE